MKWIAAVLYGLAAAHGYAGGFLDATGTGVCVGLGTVALLCAVDAIVRHHRDVGPN